MGILKDLGSAFGDLAGKCIATPTRFVGDFIDSDFIRDVADATYKVTAHTGELIGNVAEGTGKCVLGLAEKDGKTMEEGLGQVVNAGVDTLVGMGMGTMKVVGHGYRTVSSIAKGDTETAIKAGKELAKVALVSTLAIGIADVVDSVMDLNDGEDYIVVENENTHYVSPHIRTLSDGRQIWVDGDGNTSVHRDTGWIQTNPDYKISK